MANSPKPNQQLSKKHVDRLHREKMQTRWILIGTISIVVVVVGLLVYGILDQTVLWGLRSVADVNGEKISANEFRAFTKYYRYNLIQSAQQTYQFMQLFGGNDQTMSQQLVSISKELDPETAGNKALDQLIDSKVIVQEAKKDGVTINDQQIDQAVQEALGYYANGTPTPTATTPVLSTATLSSLQLTMIPPTATVVPTAVPTTTLPLTTTLPATTTVASAATATPASAPTPEATSTVAPTATPYTLEGYNKTYATVVAGLKTQYEIPAETIRYVITANLYREAMMKKIVGDVPCTAEQVWAQHILVDDEQTAQDIFKQAKQGGDWFALAAKYSKDTSNKDRGGDLGWFGKGQMVKEFEDAAFALNAPGDISVPTKSQFGWHIIRLVAHENRPLSATECDRLKATKFTDWLSGVRTAGKISIYDYWKTIYPLNPTIPAQLQGIIDQLGGGVPSGFPQPTPVNNVP
jgi:peptidyl-prolyl cis-trans isomerase D